MKKILIIFLCISGFASLSFSIWETDFIKAKQIAKDKKQLILLNFSGSDWCGPCMRMKKEIFEDKVFVSMADSNLVLINADFPRNKRNKLDKASIKQNEELADKYNPEGKFPFTVLLNAEGKIISSWDGLPNENAIKFTNRLKIICDGNKK